MDLLQSAIAEHVSGASNGGEPLAQGRCGGFGGGVKVVKVRLTTAYDLALTGDLGCCSNKRDVRVACHLLDACDLQVNTVKRQQGARRTDDVALPPV